MKTFEHYAAYWTSEAGWDTELRLKNNLPSAPLTVTPVLCLASGQEVPLPSVIIAPNASVSLSVNEALQENAPNLLGQANSYGSVIFRFNSKSSMSLYATAVPALQGAPVAFPMNAHPGGPTFAFGNNGAGSLEGIWWRARSGLKDVLVIGNSSDIAVNGTLSLFDAGGKQWSAPLSLGPRQVQRVMMSDLVREAGLTGNYGGISFAVPSAASAIEGVHFMYDEGGKFSASLEVFRRDPNATVSGRMGADQKQWTMRAPMLALTNPDPELGLSLNKSLQPTVLVRNTTPNSVSAEITLNWRGDSVGKGQVKLPGLQLPPFATKEVQIWAMQKQLGIPDDAHWALVSLTTNAAPDDLIAIASSRDCTGEYNVETKFVGGSGGNYLAGGEWRTDATHNQIAAITNVGTQPTDALLTLHYNNGVNKYELRQAIPPGDQMWLNLSQLVRQGLPDRNGSILPASTNSVTYDLQDLTPGGHSLTANDLAVNMASGQAIPNCPYCCGIGSESFFPDPVNINFGQFADIGVNGLNPCNGVDYNITVDFNTWGSSNTAVAEVTTAKAQGVGVGTATAFAEGTVNGPGQCACNPRVVEVQVPVYVEPQFTVGYNAYIPVDHIQGPTACTWDGQLVTKLYMGDANRGTYRTAEQILIVPDLQQSSGFFQDTGQTRNYGMGSPGNGSTLSSLDEDGIRYDCWLWNDAGKAVPSASHDESYPSAHHGQSHFAGSGANPLESQSATITWDMTTIFDTTSPQSPTAYVDYNHTCYPAHQIKVNGIIIYSYTPPDNSPSYLFTCLVLHDYMRVGATQPTAVPSH